MLKLSALGKSHIVEGYAVFDGPKLTGRVTFVSDIGENFLQAVRQLTDTLVIGESVPYADPSGVPARLGSWSYCDHCGPGLHRL